MFTHKLINACICGEVSEVRQGETKCEYGITALLTTSMYTDVLTYVGSPSSHEKTIVYMPTLPRVSTLVLFIITY